MKMGETIAVFSPPEKKERIKSRTPSGVGGAAASACCCCFLGQHISQFSLFQTLLFPYECMYAQSATWCSEEEEEEEEEGFFSLFLPWKTLSGI